MVMSDNRMKYLKNIFSGPSSTKNEPNVKIFHL